MRLLVLLLLLFFSLFAKPLDVKDAFKSEFIQKKDGIEFSLKIAKDIHIYKNSIKVLLNNLKLNIDLPPSKKGLLGEDIYENSFKLFIPKIGDIKITYQGCSDMVCYAPQTVTFTPKTIVKQVVKSPSNEDKIVALFNKSIWVLLGGFFLFGVLLSLTPCIFPMIPILSGLIVKAGGKGNITPLKGLFISIVYVLSMSVAYTMAGVLAGLFGGNIQALFQNPYILGSFSLLFVVLALSMFGFFEIGLPASLQTKLSMKSNKAGENGGLIGVSIMGFLSALIVGPCVAPPLAGALIYIGQTGDALLGGTALFVMSIGMGVPLFIIGLGAGKFMPRAGSWMINVNRIFGVIMLGVAIFMVSRIVPEEWVRVLWGVLAIGTGLYLNPFDKILNYKDTILKTIGVLLLIVGGSLIFKTLNPTGSVIKDKTEWQHIKNIKQLDEVVQNGKIIVDFTAKWCIACKEYEDNTFNDSRVLEKFKNYKLYKIDVTEGSKDEKELMKKFSIVGPPAILIFENGRLVQKIIGYKPPKEFLKFLK